MASIGVYVMLVLFLVTQLYVINIAGTPRSGPYKSFMLSAERCKKVRYAQHPDPPLSLYFESFNITNKSFFRGNFTVKRYVKNVKIQVKSSIWVKGKWKPNYLLPSSGCHGVMMQMIHTIFRVKYDEKYCAYFEGNYSFGDVDTNEHQHKLRATAEYGRALWTTEIYIGGKQFLSLACWQFEDLIVPK